LRATLTVNDPSPCPEVALSCIQGDSLDAVHVQSRAAVTLTGTAPPSALTLVDCAETLVWQRTPSGPTTSVTAVDPPHAEATNATARTMCSGNG
jgi:hypothetical protein